MTRIRPANSPRALSLISFGLAVVAVISGWILVQSIAQRSSAAEMPGVKITGQTALSGHLKLLWLEIDRQGHDIKEINHRQLYPPTSDCHGGLAFNPHIKENQVDKSSPILAYSWTAPASTDWICLEMVVAAPDSQTMSKLYAALQLVKPKVTITDRPAVEVVGQSTLSRHQKLVGTKIISNGYDIKGLGYHTSGLRTADCHEDLIFQPLSIGNQFDNQPELVFNLIILANGPWLCVTITYVDDSGQTVDLYLPAGVDVDDRPAAKFVAADASVAQAENPAPVETRPEPAFGPNNDDGSDGQQVTLQPEPDNAETANATGGDGNQDAAQMEGGDPLPARPLGASDAGITGAADEGSQDALQVAGPGVEAATGDDSSPSYLKVFIFVAIGIAALASAALFFLVKRSARPPSK